MARDCSIEVPRPSLIGWCGLDVVILSGKAVAAGFREGKTTSKERFSEEMRCDRPSLRVAGAIHWGGTPFRAAP